MLDDISKCKMSKGSHLFSLIQHLHKKQHCPLHTGTLKYIQMKYSVNPRLFSTGSRDYKKEIASETTFIHKRECNEKYRKDKALSLFPKEVNVDLSFMYTKIGFFKSIGDIKTLVVSILDMNITFNELPFSDFERYLVQNRNVKLEILNQQLHDQLDNVERYIGETYVLEYGTGSVRSIGLARIVEVDRKKKEQVKMQWLDKVFNSRYIWVHVNKATTIKDSPRSCSAKILQRSRTNFFVINNRESEIIRTHKGGGNAIPKSSVKSKVHPLRRNSLEKLLRSNTYGVDKLFNSSSKESSIIQPWANVLVHKKRGNSDALNDIKKKLMQPKITINSNTITKSSNIVGGWDKPLKCNSAGA